VEAAATRKFHVYPVSTVDEAMERLTGLPAGVPDAQGRLPRGSLNERIARTLAEITAALHASRDREHDRPPIRRSLRHNRFSG
jgi:hypothetical protein